jgi:hypothetical protein
MGREDVELLGGRGAFDGIVDSSVLEAAHHRAVVGPVIGAPAVNPRIGHRADGESVDRELLRGDGDRAADPGGLGADDGDAGDRAHHVDRLR